MRCRCGHAAVGAGGDIDGARVARRFLGSSTRPRAPSPTGTTSPSRAGGARPTCAVASLPVSPAGRPPRIEIPRWIQLVGLPLAAGAGVGVRDGGRSRRLPVPDRGADRAAARPDRRAASSGLRTAARPLGRGRVPDVRRGGRRSSSSRSRTVVVGQTKTAADQVQRLLHESSRRRRTDVGRSRRRSAPALAQHSTTCKSVKIEKRGHKLVRQIRQRDVGKYTHRIVDVRRGRGDLDRQDALLVRAADRRVDLHAPRHAAARTSRRPALPAATGRATAAPAHRARARVVRPRAGCCCQPDHRRRAPASGSGCSARSGCCRRRSSTPCSSAAGSRSPR